MPTTREAAIRRQAQNGRRLIRSEAEASARTGKLPSQSQHRIRVGLSELTRSRIGDWANTDEGQDYLKQKASYRADAMQNLSQDIKRTAQDLQDRAEASEWSETRLKRELRASMQDLVEGRAEMISQTETVQDQAFSTFMDAGTEEDVWLEWRAASDARPSHQIDGERVRPGEEFSNSLKYPGEPGAPASEVVNCRCSVKIIRGDS